MAGSLRLTLAIAAAGGEMAGLLARAVLARTTRSGRIDRALQRLVDAGTVAVSGDGPIDRRVLRLTDEGRLIPLGGIDPEREWSRPWDGVWRVVAFDIPEAEEARRVRLRRRLHEFRFGWLQNSVWISPHPIDAFRAQLGESGIAPDSLTYFEARSVGGETPAALVGAAWDFDRINRSYADYRKILQLRPATPLGTKTQWWKWLQSEHRAWRLIARRDPFLPTTLLPKEYAGQVAWAERREAHAGFARAWA